MSAAVFKMATGAEVLITTCEVCGSLHSPFGVDVALRKGQLGKWYCYKHWPGRKKPKEKTSGEK